MCCVLFGWMTNQTYFKELTNVDIRERMFLEQQDQLEQDMAPFGFMDNGIDDPLGETVIDEYGQRWSPVVRDYDRLKLVKNTINSYIISIISFSYLI